MKSMAPGSILLIYCYPIYLFPHLFSDILFQKPKNTLLHFLFASFILCSCAIYLSNLIQTNLSFYRGEIDNLSYASGCKYLFFVCRYRLHSVAWFSYWFDNLGFITEGNTYRSCAASFLPLWGNTDAVLSHVSTPIPPATSAKAFDINAALLNLVMKDQISGSPNEDPASHLNTFVELCDMKKEKDIDNFKLKLFPFSLRDKAKAWFSSLPRNSIGTWDKCKDAFIAKYFPPAKIISLRNQIMNFKQHEQEHVAQSWERMK